LKLKIFSNRVRYKRVKLYVAKTFLILQFLKIKLIKKLKVKTFNVLFIGVNSFNCALILFLKIEKKDI
jgi:hypothetical protein